MTEDLSEQFQTKKKMFWTYFWLLAKLLYRPKTTIRLVPETKKKTVLNAWNVHTSPDYNNEIYT